MSSLTPAQIRDLRAWARAMLKASIGGIIFAEWRRAQDRFDAIVTELARNARRKGEA